MKLSPHTAQHLRSFSKCSSLKRPFPFPLLHGCPSVYSLRVRKVPLFRSSRRLGAFALSPHPGVHSFPVLRLLRPFRHFLRTLGFRPGSPLFYCPLPCTCPN